MRAGLHLASRPRSTNSEVDSTPQVSLGGEEVGADETIMSQEDYLFGVLDKRSTFTDLGAHSSLARALESCGKRTATIIQSKTFSAVIGGKDVVIGAETGSGKTMAYMVPLVQRCLEANFEEDDENREDKDELDEFNVSKNYPKILVMVPNKELVLQVAYMTQDLLGALQKESGEEGPLVTAETCTMQQSSWFYRDADAPDILICTPAIISKFIRGPTIEEVELFKNVRHVVFDEADMLLEGSYLSDVEKVLEAFRLTRREQIRSGEIGINDKTVQYVLSAATLPTYGLKSMDSYIKKKFPEATTVSNDYLHKHHPQIRQSFVELEADSASTHEHVPVTHPRRVEAVLSAVGQAPAGGSTMVFVNTADAALALAAALEESGVQFVQFHKAVSSRDKQQGLQAFRNGESGVLICTDAAARGLDLPTVSHVVQAEFALNVVQYLHRVGRASRGGREGHATSIVDPRSRDLVHSIRTGQDRSVAQSFSRKRGFRAKVKKERRRSGAD
jgi:superfamily II DNA/RNA helicase